MPQILKRHSEGGIAILHVGIKASTGTMHLKTGGNTSQAKWTVRHNAIEYTCQQYFIFSPFGGGEGREYPIIENEGDSALKISQILEMRKLASRTNICMSIRNES